MITLRHLEGVSKSAGGNNQFYALCGADWPTGSIKYVSVLGMMAHMQNRLAGCTTVYGSTSGNTGLAAVTVCKTLGLHFHAIVDTRIETEKLESLIEHGATVTKVEGDVHTRIRIAAEMAVLDPAGIDLDQYGNEGALFGHYQITGPMIWHDMAGNIDAVVVALGTGGTFGGVAAFLTEQNPHILTIAVDAYGSALIHGKPGKRLLTGIGCAFIPKNVRRAYQHIRGTPYVATDEEAFSASRQLLDEEGIGVGGSGGAVLSAAMNLARKVQGKRIVMIFHDGAAAYASTIFSDRWMTSNGFDLNYARSLTP